MRGPATPCHKPSAHGLVPVTLTLRPRPRARATPIADQRWAAWTARFPGGVEMLACRVVGSSRRLIRFALTASCAVELAPAGVSGAPPDAPSHADRLFEEGRALLDAERVAEACAKFGESFELDEALGTLLNLALCHELEGKTASAWREFGRAAELAERLGEHEREAFAADKVRQLEPRLSRLTVRATRGEPGLRVFLDGEELEAAALQRPLPIDPGEHALRATVPGAAAWETRVTIVSGAAETIVELPKLGTRRTADKPSTPAIVAEAPRAGRTQGWTTRREAPATTAGADGSSAPTPWVFVAGGVGLAGLGVGTYFGLRAWSAQQTVDDECDGRFCTEEGLRADRTAHDSVWPANIGIGVGVLGVGVASYLWLNGRPSNGAQTAVTLSPLPAGLRIAAEQAF